MPGALPKFSRTATTVSRAFCVPAGTNQGVWDVTANMQQVDQNCINFCVPNCRAQLLWDVSFRKPFPRASLLDTGNVCLHTISDSFFSKYEPWTLIFGNNFSSSFARPRFGRGSIKLHVRFGSAFLRWALERLIARVASRFALGALRPENDRVALMLQRYSLIEACPLSNL